MRVAAIKLILLLFTLNPNNNYELKETRKHACHLNPNNNYKLKETIMQFHLKTIK